jgi:queuine tRNA-ribosyltransferase
MPFPSFQVLHQSPQGRLGELKTAHGTIQTPCFFFCATKGALKGLSVQSIEQLHTPVLLANTYHLMLQPGAERIAQAGGLGPFMGWSGPMFTDSGGYQIFSLGHGCVSQEIKGSPRAGRYLKMTEEGASFRSYRDGNPWCLTPELSIHVQQALGADCIFVLDECTPYHVSESYTARSMRRSHRWATRSLKAFDNPQAPYKKDYQGLYGISQGGVYPELRRESRDFLNDTPFFGYGIGGSLGATSAQMREVVAVALEGLRPERPIHLLGIGRLEDIFDGVALGIDTFDCVIPTRLGRHGGALIRPSYWQEAREPFHKRSSINLLKACFQDDDRPIDALCACPTCQNHSRAYIRHLFLSKEMLGPMLLVAHNMFFMNAMMGDIRQALAKDQLAQVRKTWLTEASCPTGPIIPVTCP